MIDLRSDTATRPTEAMLDTMMSAKVGADVYDEDEAVSSLQRHAAEGHIQNLSYRDDSTVV